MLFLSFLVFALLSFFVGLLFFSSSRSVFYFVYSCSFGPCSGQQALLCQRLSGLLPRNRGNLTGGSSVFFVSIQITSPFK